MIAGGGRNADGWRLCIGDGMAGVNKVADGCGLCWAVTVGDGRGSLQGGRSYHVNVVNKYFTHFGFTAYPFAQVLILSTFHRGSGSLRAGPGVHNGCLYIPQSVRVLLYCTVQTCHEITVLVRNIYFDTVLLHKNKKPEMRSFKSNENIHKKEGGSYYVVSANKASSVTL